MAELDFSALRKLAYRGFETAEEQAQRDALIEQGFTVTEDKGNPFLQASEAAPQASSESPPRASAEVQAPASATPQNASGGRYKRHFRAAYNFLEEAERMLESASGDPQRLDSEWNKIGIKGADILGEFEDAFITEMLTAITDELYRRYFTE